MQIRMTLTITALILVLLTGACGSGGDGNSSDSGDDDDSSSSGEIPSKLNAIESLAEDTFDMALASDFASVADKASQLDQDWDAFRDQAKADGASDSVLTQMDQAVADLLDGSDAGFTDPVIAARAANAVSAPMPDLFDLYNPQIPSAVLALDYLGREVVLDGMEEDFTAALTDVDAIQAEWDGLRPSLVDAGGSDVATAYDDSLAALRQDITDLNSDALIEEANVGLEIVDDMEKVFEG